MKDIPVLHVRGKSIAEGYEKAIYAVYTQGCEISTQYDKPGDPLSKDCTLNLVIEEPESDPMIHKAFPGGIEDLREYVMELHGAKDEWVKNINDSDDTRWEYCVDPNTNILTDKFYEKKIKDCNIGDNVMCFDFTKKKLVKSKILDKVYSKANPIKFIFEDDTEIITSKIHPLYKCGVGWIKASDIKIGDYISVTHSGNYNLELHYTSKDEFTLVNKNDILDLPFNINKENIIKELESKNLLPFTTKNINFYKIILLIGYIFGDGWLSTLDDENNRKYCRGKVGFAGEYTALKKIQNVLYDIGYETENIRSNDFECIYKNRKIKGTSLSLTCGYTSLWALLYCLGIPIGKKSLQEYNLPEFVLKSSDINTKKSFLIGFFDAELSSVTKSGSGYGSLVYFRQSKLQKYKQNLINFVDNIESIIKSINNNINIRKLKVLTDGESLTYGLSIGNHNNLIEFFKTFDNIFKLSSNKMFRYNMYVDYSRYCELTKEKLNVKNLSGAKIKSINEFFGDNIQNKMLYSKVKKIINIQKRCELVDIAIEHKDHNFIGNGIVCHNTYHNRLARYGGWKEKIHWHDEQQEVVEKSVWKSNYTNNETINQVEWVINKLIKQPYTRQAQMITWMPEWDMDCYDPPCLQSIWLRIIEDNDTWVLNTNIRFRSNDGWGASFMNMFGIMRLVRTIADKISTKAGKPVILGRLNWQADSYHIYGKDIAACKKMLIDKIETGLPFEKRIFNFYDDTIQEMYKECEPMILEKIVKTSQGL